VFWLLFHLDLVTRIEKAKDFIFWLICVRANVSLLLRTWHTSGIRKYVHGRPTGGSGSSKIRPWLDDFEHLVVPTGFLVIESMNIRARIGKGKV
jgi:hypothetical protein